MDFRILHRALSILFALIMLAGCAHAERRVAGSNALYNNARSFNVTKSEAGQSVFLEAASCQNLYAPATALKEWNMGEGAIDCVCHEGSCSVDVTKYLPDFVRATLGTKRLKPNCFNTALLGARLATELEFTRFFEFAKVLRERCTRIGEPKAGDIGVVSIHGASFEPIHAFTYLTPEFGYEKPGSDSSEPWRFMNSAEILGGNSSAYPRSSSDLFYYRCR